MTGRTLATGLSALLACTGSVTAQESGANLVPYLGYYVPVGNLMEFEFQDIGGPIDITVNHETQFLVGACLDVWLSRAWGVKGTFGYSWSDAHVESRSGNVVKDDLCGGPDVDCDGNVWLASARGLYRFFFGQRKRSSLQASAGFAVIGHGGRFYDSVEGDTDVGGVIGLGLTFNASRSTLVTLEVEDYAYSYGGTVHLDAIGRPIETQSRLQNDIVLSLGVEVPLSR